MKRSRILFSVLAAVLAVALMALNATVWAQKGKPPQPPPLPADPAIAFVDDTALWVMNADGTNQTAVFSNATVQKRVPNWSPDGQQLVFFSDVAGEGIYIVNVDGTGLRKVVDVSTYQARPSWSPVALPDGRYKIAYTASVWSDKYNQTVGDVFLMNVDGTGAPFNLTQTEDWYEFYPRWSPDGTKLAVVAYDMINYFSGPPDIVVYQLIYDANGNPGVRMLNNLTADGTPYADAWPSHLQWSKAPLRPDKLIFNGPDGDIWIADAYDPNSFRRLTGGTYPSFSPDDLRAVFARTTYSPRQSYIFVINADGTVETMIAKAAKKNNTYRECDWRRNH